jgi:acetylornithine deacetylase/succinyl-diaminopimelate desuccinylase-like protein
MLALSPVLEAIDANLDHSLERLFALLRIPSISTDPAYDAECRRAAEWLARDLAQIGFSASVRDTAGHPMVVAHHEGPAGAPHLVRHVPQPARIPAGRVIIPPTPSPPPRSAS